MQVVEDTDAHVLTLVVTFERELLSHHGANQSEVPRDEVLPVGLASRPDPPDLFEMSRERARTTRGELGLVCTDHRHAPWDDAVVNTAAPIPARR